MYIQENEFSCFSFLFFCGGGCKKKTNEKINNPPSYKGSKGLLLLVCCQGALYWAQFSLLSLQKQQNLVLRNNDEQQ